MDSTLTRIIEFGDRHQRIITIVSGIWLVISTATWMPFWPLPDIPYVTDRNFWVSSAIWNTVWWGMANPALYAHRKKMDKKREAQAALSDPENIR